MPEQKNRFLIFDIIRTLAVALIVFCHSIDLAEYTRHIPNWRVWIPLHAISHIGVPLFLMISGALLVGRDYKNPISFWLKRLPQFIFLTIFIAYGETWVSALMYGKSNFTLGSLFHSPSFTELLHGKTGTAYQLWYMYAITELYLITPAISALVKGMSLSSAVVFITFCILGSFDFTGTEDHLHNTSTVTNLLGCHPVYYGVYFALGYYISVLSNNHLKKVPTSLFYILLSLTLFILDHEASKSWKGDIENLALYNSGYILFASVFLFAGLMKSSDFFESICPNSLRGFFRFLSEGSFSIFLYHTPWIVILGRLAEYLKPVPLFVLVVLYFVGAIIVGLVPFIFLRKIPFLRRLVF